MNKICCNGPRDSFVLPLSKFFTLKMRKRRCGPDTGDLKPQTQMRLGLNVEKAEKHNEDIVKLNI